MNYVNVKTALIAAFIISVIGFGQFAQAVPMPPMATMTIEGTIEKISWHAEQTVKGRPGISGSASRDRTVPAHYKVTLADTKVTAKGSGHVPFSTGKPIATKLNHPQDDGFLEQGMSVRITGFKLNGDEGGVSTNFEKIEILNANGEKSQVGTESKKADGGKAQPGPATDQAVAKKRMARYLERAFPMPEAGMTRHLLILEPLADESQYRVELIVGKTIETDGVNHYSFAGKIEHVEIKGWGFHRYVVAKDTFRNLMSTEIAPAPGTPKKNEFVQVGGSRYPSITNLLRYNSTQPIAVYIPEGGEVRYRIWRADEQTQTMSAG